MESQVRSSIVQRIRAHKKALLVALVLLVLFSVAGVAIRSTGRFEATNSQASIPTVADSVGVAPSTGGDGKTVDGLTQNTAAQSWDRMVIRTATLQLTVKDVGATADRVMSLASQHGGYVTSSETNHQGDSVYSTITIQVPSRDFDQIMPLLEHMDGMVVKVVDESVTSSDVTEEYTDNQSQLRNLQATEGRMLALQAKADKMEDILAIDHELRDIQGQIETIQGRINYLSKRSEMSTVTITLWPESAPAPTIAPPVSAPAWEPFKVVENAWNASMVLLAFVSTLLISVAVFLWWLIPFCLIGALIVMWSRRRRAAPTVAVDTLPS